MKCLKCSKPVFTSDEERIPGTFVINPTKNPGYENDKYGQFIRCPHCRARNYTEALPHKEGEPYSKQFSHYKDN